LGLIKCGFLNGDIMSGSAKYLVAVVGPTAVGKTALAIDLAMKYGAEIISADSRQLYREFNIAVAKPTVEELDKVRHNFVGWVSIHDDYDAAKFGEEALGMIAELHAHHNFAVLCGGSGLYIRSLLEGFDTMPNVPDEVRQRIIDSYEANGIEWLQGEVESADPDYFEVVDRKNPQRLMRALEVIQAAGLRPSALRMKKKRDLPFHVIKVGLHLERAQLYERIDRRVDEMVKSGLFEEAAALFPFRALNALQTVGYQEIFGYMEGLYDRDEAIRLLKRNTRRYAKRQMTWFRKDTEIKWFQPDQLDEIIHYIEHATAG
jgi:tRNA dimethylallyltransferase